MSGLRIVVDLQVKNKELQQVFFDKLLSKQPNILYGYIIITETKFVSHLLVYVNKSLCKKKSNFSIVYQIIYEITLKGR